MTLATASTRIPTRTNATARKPRDRWPMTGARMIGSGESAGSAGASGASDLCVTRATLGVRGAWGKGAADAGDDGSGDTWTTVPHFLQRSVLRTQSAGMRKTFWQPGQVTRTTWAIVGSSREQRCLSQDALAFLHRLVAR